MGDYFPHLELPCPACAGRYPERAACPTCRGAGAVLTDAGKQWQAWWERCRDRAEYGKEKDGG